MKIFKMMALFFAAVLFIGVTSLNAAGKDGKCGALEKDAKSSMESKKSMKAQKCGAGKCGDSKKEMKSEKCGAGKCGDSKKPMTEKK